MAWDSNTTIVCFVGLGLVILATCVDIFALLSYFPFSLGPTKPKRTEWPIAQYIVWAAGFACMTSSLVSNINSTPSNTFVTMNNTLRNAMIVSVAVVVILCVCVGGSILLHVNRLGPGKACGLWTGFVVVYAFYWAAWVINAIVCYTAATQTTYQVFSFLILIVPALEPPSFYLANNDKSKSLCSRDMQISAILRLPVVAGYAFFAVAISSISV